MLKQLSCELQNRGKAKLTSLYFGGGTPSLLDIADFEKIFKKILPYTHVNAEITVEANPSSWNKEKAKALIEMGANRLSLGIQSLNDAKLTLLSRVHNAKSALEAYEASIAVGFSNISVDFMYDTPFDDEKFLKAELDSFLALNATHISAYSLTIEEGTLFEKKSIQSRYDANAAKEVATRLKAAGYEHYEVASFGRERSKHNLGYWEYKQYLGVGAGAVGFDGKSRRYPHKALERYIENPLFVEMEELSNEDIKTEKILLGLRSAVGVELSLLKDKQKEVDMLLQNNLLKIEGNQAYCVDFFLADELALRLS